MTAVNKHVQVWAQHRAKTMHHHQPILPPGQWVFLGNFPYECQPDELVRFLSDAGIELDESRVAIRSSGGDGKAYAIISLPPAEVAHLVERAISAIPPLYDRELRVLPSEKVR